MKYNVAAFDGDELKRAVEIIKHECCKHTACIKCPLEFVMCIYRSPDEWQPDGLKYEAEEGVKNDR